MPEHRRQRDNSFTGMRDLRGAMENIRVLIARVGSILSRMSAIEQEMSRLDGSLNRVAEGTSAGDTVNTTTGTPFSFRRVDALPAVGTEPEIVVWTVDDGFWASKPGTAYWAPLGHFSNQDGTP